MNVDRLQRDATVEFGGALPRLADLESPARDWHGALPYTRIVDYGMDEADARELLWRTARGEDWTPTALEIGRRQRARVEKAASEGHTFTAEQAAIAAAGAFNVAQVPIAFDEPTKRAVYRDFHESVLQYAWTRGGMERLEVDYEGGVLDGWLLVPDGHIRGAVVVWGGLSGWGAAYLGIARKLTDRGLACILAEGPGQGSTRLERQTYGSPETLPGYGAFIAYAKDDRRLAGVPTGLFGNSFGGMLAARIVAQDSRIAACVINGAPSTLELPETGGALDQILAFVGTTERARAVDALRGLTIDPAIHRIDVPLLVLHGGADPMVSEENILRFLAASDHPDSKMLIWPDGEHTLYNHSQERDALVADWFLDRLTT